MIEYVIILYRLWDWSYYVPSSCVWRWSCDLSHRSICDFL